MATKAFLTPKASPPVEFNQQEETNSVNHLSHVKPTSPRLCCTRQVLISIPDSRYYALGDIAIFIAFGLFPVPPFCEMMTLNPKLAFQDHC